MNAYTLHKLKEGFIITSDEQIAINDIVYSMDGIHEWFGKILKTEPLPLKVIAQHHQIDFSALSEEDQKEVGWFDVEKLADKWACENGVKNAGVLVVDHSPLRKLENTFIAGFKKAQELLSDRMFTLEDMKKMYDLSCGNIGLGLLPDQTENIKRFNKFLNDIFQPKSWKVELEMEIWNTGNLTSLSTLKPKSTNGKVKILKLL